LRLHRGRVHRDRLRVADLFLDRADRPMSFATLELDDVSGLRFIIDWRNGQRLYKHPNCALCGIPRYSRHTVLPSCDARCDTHPKRRAFE
jgi:hypothetical protein